MYLYIYIFLYIYISIYLHLYIYLHIALHWSIYKPLYLCLSLFLSLSLSSNVQYMWTLSLDGESQSVYIYKSFGSAMSVVVWRKNRPTWINWYRFALYPHVAWCPPVIVSLGPTPNLLYGIVSTTTYTRQSSIDSLNNPNNNMVLLLATCCYVHFNYTILACYKPGFCDISCVNAPESTLVRLHLFLRWF